MKILAQAKKTRVAIKTKPGKDHANHKDFLNQEDYEKIVKPINKRSKLRDK